MKEDGIDTPLLYTDRFHTDDGKAVLHILEWKEPDEKADSEYDLMLDNGRLLEQFQAMNQTGRGARIWAISPRWFVEVSPELAAARGIEEGSWLRITSRRGSVEAPAVITDRVSGKTLFMPIHQSKEGVNALTGEHHDPDVDTPAYKELAVRIEVLRRQRDGSPIPDGNFRHGERTPVEGVPVDVKWGRSDYAPPPRTEPHPERF